MYRGEIFSSFSYGRSHPLPSFGGALPEGGEWDGVKPAARAICRRKREHPGAGFLSRRGKRLRRCRRKGRRPRGCPMPDNFLRFHFGEAAENGRPCPARPRVRSREKGKDGRQDACPRLSLNTIQNFVKKM